jgi:hypothetical protein
MKFHAQDLSLTVMLHIQSYILQVNSSNICSIIDNPGTILCIFNRTTVNILRIYINKLSRSNPYPITIHSHHFI